MFDIDKDNRILEFLNSAPRFKIVVLGDDSFDASLSHVNVGKTVANYLKEHNLSKQAFDGVKDFLSSQITAITQVDDQFGKYICLTNLGILFEKVLDFSPADFLSTISKNTLLLLHWQGTIKQNKLFFLDEDSPLYIDLQNINYITI